MSAGRHQRMRRAAGWVPWLLMGWGVGAAAQSPPSTAPASPPEDTLGRLIKEYEAQRATIERPLLTVYSQRLAALRDTLEKRRDPGAAAVAAEISAVQTKLGRVESASVVQQPEDPAPDKPLTAPLELPGRKARTFGGASTGADDNSPVQFAGKDSAAEWALPKLSAGRYRLLWRIACDIGAGATVRLSIDGQPARTLEIVPTSNSGEALVANLGEFTASAPPAWLKVEVMGVPGRPRKDGPSFSLAKLVLIPPGVTMPGL